MTRPPGGADEPRRLAVIISADDFGLAPAINEGVLLAHRRGCLTSASLSVAGPAAAEAARVAGECPDLGVGLHLTLIDERPVLPPEAIPSLAGRNGRLPPDALGFAGRWFGGRIRRRDLRQEVRAQIARLLELGIRPTHLDSHQHLHVLPGVLEIVMQEMTRAGLARMRNPLELATVDRAGWS